MAKRVTHPLEDFIVEKDPLKRDLNNELPKAFATDLRPYDVVQVLLICWQSADSNNHQDLVILKAFLEKEFHYSVKIYQIIRDAFKYDKKSLIKEFTLLHEASTAKTLTIIGYSGHGYSNSTKPNRSERKDLVIFPRGDIMDQIGFNPVTCSFGINYSDVFGWLFSVEGVVLHLLDCCSGGGAFIDGAHEVIAASATHQPGKRMRSSIPSGRLFAAIIESLKELKRTHLALTTVQLHSFAVNMSLSFKSELYIQPYYAGRFEKGKRPITITPLLPPSEVNSKVSSEKSLLKETKVLLSISIEHGDKVDNDNAANMVKEMYQWLNSRDRPEWVKDIELVGVFRSHSMVLLLTLPISLWDVLPEHPAYKKVAFVTGGNMLLSQAARKAAGIDESVVNAINVPDQQ